MHGTWLVPSIAGTWVSVDDMGLLVHPAPLGALHVGDQIFRRIVVRDEDGFESDATMAGTMTRPGASAVNLTIQRESLGHYLVTFPVFATRGMYSWRIAASGAVNRVEKGTLRVQA